MTRSLQCQCPVVSDRYLCQLTCDGLQKPYNHTGFSYQKRRWRKKKKKKIGLTVISDVEEAIGLWKGKPVKERIETAVRLIVGLRGCSSYLFGGHLLRVGQ